MTSPTPSDLQKNKTDQNFSNNPGLIRRCGRQLYSLRRGLNHYHTYRTLDWINHCFVDRRLKHKPHHGSTWSNLSHSFIFVDHLLFCNETKVKLKLKIDETTPSLPGVSDVCCAAEEQRKKLLMIPTGQFTGSTGRRSQNWTLREESLCGKMPTGHKRSGKPALICSTKAWLC